MLTWIIATLVVLALVAFPPTRSALAWILDVPGKLLFQWAMFLVMRLFQAHFSGAQEPGHAACGDLSYAQK
jgi:hypothetical protein